MKYYLVEHRRTGVIPVAGISAEILVIAAQNAGHDKTQADHLFDATHSVVHWTNTEYEDAKNKWYVEPGRGAGLITLRVSSGGQSELQTAVHQKWKRNNVVAYVLNARNQSMLLQSEVATAFFKMTVKDAENVFSDKLDQVNKELRRLFERPRFFKILTALHILCQGFLMRLQLSPIENEKDGKKEIYKKAFSKVFGDEKAKTIIENVKKEWESLSSKTDFNDVKFKAVESFIMDASSGNPKLDTSVIKNAYLALNERLGAASD